MSRRPTILTIAFQRPYAVRTHRGMEVAENRHVWGALGEICEIITGRLNAMPMLLPTNIPAEDIPDIMKSCDGVLLPGGVSHVHPACYGQEPSHDRQIFDRARDALELAILKEAQRRRLPVMGICRGMQMINVFYGGTLTAEPECSRAIDHMCSVAVHGRGEAPEHTHGLIIAEDGRLADWLGKTDAALRVNSIHEQAIKTLGKGLRVEARAPDGVTEAIATEDPKHFVFGVQWHPDFNPHLPASNAVLEAFEDECRAQYKKRTSWLGWLAG